MAGAILAIIGGALAWRQYQSNKTAEQKAAAAEYRANHGYATGEVPSTIKPKPSEFDSYTVSDNHPRYIFIPKIGVKAIVKPTWLTASGAVGSPDNIYNTAWYASSALPGQPGAALIDGHSGFWNKTGVFWNLGELKPGDLVKIEKGDGTIVDFEVVKKTIYPADAVDMKAMLSPINQNSPGLNLITCTGDVIAGTNRYDERVAIFAQKITDSI